VSYTTKINKNALLTVIRNSTGLPGKDTGRIEKLWKSVVMTEKKLVVTELKVLSPSLTGIMGNVIS
jgi:hypothetical protein